LTLNSLHRTPDLGDVFGSNGHGEVVKIVFPFWTWTIKEKLLFLMAHATPLPEKIGHKESMSFKPCASSCCRDVNPSLPEENQPQRVHVF